MAEITTNPTVPWTEQLLGRDHASFSGEARRLVVAIALASSFGAALGLRGGGAAIPLHAVGVTAGIVAVCALAVPALAILLALANASVRALDLARATARAAAATGLLLAGLAPGAALFAVTVEDAITVSIVGGGGLALAGALGIRTFLQALAPSVAASDPRGRRLASAAIPLFLIFAIVLGGRIWWLALPLLPAGFASVGGAS